MQCFFFSSRRRHTRFDCDWSSDVCSSDLHGKQKHGRDSLTKSYRATARTICRRERGSWTKSLRSSECCTRPECASLRERIPPQGFMSFQVSACTKNCSASWLRGLPLSKRCKSRRSI